MIQFFVEGTPKAQPRHRQGKFGAYTPDSVKGWRELIWIEARKHVPSEPHRGGVIMAVTYYFQRPKNHFRTNGEVKPRFQSDSHLGKPDADNLIKSLKDELQQIGMYRNDSQVYELHIVKLWTALHARSGMNVQISLEK